MKLQVQLVLVSLLCSQALALKCYECIPGLSGTCTSSQTNCPDQCASSTTAVIIGSEQREINSKSCGTPQECMSGSVNLGILQVTVNSVCCSTDLCNSQNPPALPRQPPNGKMCYSCTGEDCSGTVYCVGNQDRCISGSEKANGTQIELKGCASKSICTDLSVQAAGIKDVSCCEGNLCNSAKSINLSLFIVLGPLLSSIFLLH